MQQSIVLCLWSRPNIVHDRCESTLSRREKQYKVSREVIQGSYLPSTIIELLYVVMMSVRTVQEHEETECLSHSNSLDGISLTDTVRRDVEDVFLPLASWI